MFFTIWQNKNFFYSSCVCFSIYKLFHYFCLCLCYYNYTFFILNIYLIYTFFICYLYVFLNSFCTKPKHFPPFFIILV
ncbi:hypothetical protein FU054_08070 [Campylobacter jejuni]|nr:hypothetical protein [Campylobacter jejuni]